MCVDLKGGYMYIDVGSVFTSVVVVVMVVVVRVVLLL